MPLNTEMIEQIFHELCATGRTIIAEIDSLAARVWDIVGQEGQPAPRKTAKARTARKARKSKAR